MKPTDSMKQAQISSHRGNAALLETRKMGLLCSRACPGSVIVQTLDVVRAIRDTPWTIVSGFQSPVEQECLEILLRGQHPVIVCPARSVEGMRLPAAWKAAVAAGRMLVTSPFVVQASCLQKGLQGSGKSWLEARSTKYRRATAALAEERNRFVVSLADQVIVAHASPGGSVERLCREILVVQASCPPIAGWKPAPQDRLEACTTTSKPLWTVDDPANAHLVALGARTFDLCQVPRNWGSERARGVKSKD